MRETVDFLLDLVQLAVPRSKRSYETVQLDDADDVTPYKGTTYNTSGNVNKKRKHQLDEEKRGEEVDENQPLVAEPGVPITLSTLKRKSCLICDSPRTAFLTIRNAKFEHLCSESCVEKYKKVRNQPDCLSCRSGVEPGLPAYRPNFGVIGGAVCSQTCLLKYDDRFGPKAKCRNGRCAQPITHKSSVTFHWQSMDFCSAACVNEMLRAVGAKCTQCRAVVPFSAIGKYSVRFGDVVRQFCNTACLSSHKKSHRSCFFCQTEIKSSSSHSYSSSARPVDRDFGEGVRSFCNNTCLDDFMRLDATKKMNRETETTIEMSGGNYCDICLCYYESDNPPTSPDHMLFRNPQEEVIFLCGTICASAYRYKHKINSLFCNYCYKLEWNLTTGVLLRFSEKSKIFCSRRCMNLFIIRVRKLMNCACCKCCKYQFDLIEECDASGETTYFCSLTCLNLNRESKSLKVKYGSRLDFIKCLICLKIKKGVFHVNDKHDPTNVYSFCTYTCYSNYLKNPPKPPPPKPKPLPKAVEPPPVTLHDPSLVSYAATNGTASTAILTGPATAALRNLATTTSSATSTLSHSMPSILTRPAVSNAESRSSAVTASGSQVQSGTLTISTIANIRQKVMNGTPISSKPKHTLTVDLESPLGKLVVYIREQGIENSDLKGLLQRAQNGQAARTLPSPAGTTPSAPASNVKEILVVKEKPKQMTNAAVQVRRGAVTKAIQCKPYLVDASVSTEDD